MDYKYGKIHIPSMIRRIAGMVGDYNSSISGLEYVIRHKICSLVVCFAFTYRVSVYPTGTTYVSKTKSAIIARVRSPSEMEYHKETTGCDTGYAARFASRLWIGYMRNDAFGSLPRMCSKVLHLSVPTVS